MKTISAFMLSFALFFGFAPAHAAESFYAGKTLTIVVGYPPGGGYAAYAQVLSRHIGKHIPGNPTVVVQHMPGGGSIVAANHLFNRTKPDGLTIGMVNMFNMYSSHVGKGEGVFFDVSKWSYIGNLRSGLPILLMRSDSFPTFEAIKSAKRPVRLGHARKGDGHHLFALAVEEGLGVKFNHIFGYGGGGEIDLGLERGELDGRAANLNSYLVSKPDWIKSGFVNVLVQGGIAGKEGNIVRDPRIPQVPTIRERFPKDRVDQLMDFNSVGELLAGVYVAPPRTPDDRLKLLRDGFLKTLNDAFFQAQAEKLNLEITPMSSKEVEEIVKRALKVSPEILEWIKQLKE
jgi:tripartite-type tricarboxylate transporter receptor subunit TctC